MDDPALQDRVARIERRQRLLLAGLLLPNFYAAGELFGYWAAGAAAAALAVLALVALVVVSRRRAGDAADGAT
ncbi:hypothetical protein [Halobacterium sp. CBA1126]|uniref:hypothetical protein n=1 Tax=Halobacterium sp. CBA1126 TaxID=2668074 RepID=UPI0012F9825A|nr:hypothetical protein [Halobacterium sp. CBA1126]MUV60313.1 hypothetical protein [Halobacterium sp. CBA1126]